MRAAIAAIAAIIAACDASPGGQTPGGPVGAEPGGRSPTGRAPGQDENSSQQNFIERAGDLPAQGAGPRFVGKWAVDQKSCQSAAWQFTANTLRTPAGASCSFDRVTQLPGGYDVQATCAAKGPPASERIEIRFDEAAKAMLFASRTIARTSLVYCGRDA